MAGCDNTIPAEWHTKQYELTTSNPGPSGNMRSLVGRVPVQSFGSDSIKALRTRTGSGSENCIPDCGRPVVFVPKFAEVELTFPDPMYEFNTGDGG